jgi:hypothetical protein
MIDLKMLKEFQKKKEKLKKDCYKKVLKKCHNKIFMVSKTGASNCWYQVPELTFGLPIYDLEECSKYINKKLKKNGLEVDYYKPNLLYISWKI